MKHDFLFPHLVAIPTERRLVHLALASLGEMKRRTKRWLWVARFLLHPHISEKFDMKQNDKRCASKNSSIRSIASSLNDSSESAEMIIPLGFSPSLPHK